ncbi:uncharacterized protein LOC142231415 [Haematobia irritans]|uniref:uncharacterized protein LOC142231415 n=1 Tax=Haematobia irritans TaxID=7368 RepID=UPI003F4FA253
MTPALFDEQVAVAAAAAMSLTTTTTTASSIDDNESFDYHVAASTGNQKMNMADVEAKYKDVPDRYLLLIAHFLAGHINDTDAMDRFNGPILKASIKNVYWIFLIQYAILAMLGIVMNVAIIAYIVYHRLYQDVTHAFIINLAFCHFVQCAVVLPISLMVMLIQNWIFGQFLCFFLPMLQDIPLHVAMITHILIAWDRMRWLGNPLKGRFPAFVCCCATWLTGMVIALPYPIYTIYVEIGEFLPRLHGMGLCVVNLMDDMHEYVRGLFFMMYCAPTVLLSYLYIRTSQELRPPEEPLAVMLYEHRADIRMRQRNSSASSVERSYSGATTATIGGGGGGGSGLNGNSHHSTVFTGPYSTGTATRSYDLYSAEWDVNREKRNQRNFGSMAAAQVVCLCPLMILRFARLSMEETYENQKHFDFTYLMFVWIAFLPTVIFPCIYATQILPRDEQERLRGYFRLSSKRRGSGATGGRCSDGNIPSSRENSIEKDENTNTTQATTSIILNGDGYMSGLCGGTAGPAGAIIGPGAGGGANEAMTTQKHDSSRNVATGKYQHQNSLTKEPTARTAPPRQFSKEGKSLKRSEGPFTNGSVHGDGGKKYKRSKETGMMAVGNSDVRINIISDGKTKSSTAAATTARRGGAGGGGGGGGSLSSANGSAVVGGLGGQQRKLTLESLDNRSASNITASTYCNGSSSLADDGDVSNFGDGEDSSIVSGMIVQGCSNGSSNGLPPYYEKKPSGMSLYSSTTRTRDMSFDDCSSTFSRLDSSSTLAREMEILDRLERERSNMDMQELLRRDNNSDLQKRRDGERRRLPDIDKICLRSPKGKRDSYSYEKSNNTSITSLSAKVPTSTDPLNSSDAYSINDGEGDHILPYDDENLRSTKSSQRCSIDEEVPSDFFDPYTPGDTTAILPASAPAVSGSGQYQYSRRLSRKSSSHHNPGVASSHRMSKRDSFNSLHSNDLIAGAFGELDPTQPLTKMSVIENRMVRRSGSGRTSSFSSSARSSMKSRDYSHSSAHSTHPELDFRENFLADL